MGRPEAPAPGTPRKGTNWSDWNPFRGVPDWLAPGRRSDPAGSDNPTSPNYIVPRGEKRGYTQQVADYYNWGGGQDMYAAMAAGEGQMAKNDEAAARAAAVAALFGDGADGGSSRSGSGSGYNVQSMIDQINESFDRQQQALDAQRGAGSTGIQNAYNQFASNVGRDYADYTGAAQQSQAAMAQRVAQQIAEAQARQMELQRSSQSMGQDIGALTQQQAGNLAALQASSGFQQDLSQRLAQIIANNQRSVESGGELVRQGAMGNLETNYQALLGALQANREGQIMSARSGGGGGGGGSKQRTTRDIRNELEDAQWIDEYIYGKDSGGDFAGVSTDKLFEVWSNAFQSDDPAQQALAAQIQPYLAQKSK